MVVAMIAASSLNCANASTWSHNWNTSKNDGGEGFYNTSAPDTLSTTIKDWTWQITGTTKYLYIAGTGQTIGSVGAYASHASMFTYDAPGQIKSVSIKARRQKDSEEATMQVSVNGIAYICNDNNTIYLTTDSLLYTFTPVGPAQSGKLDIEFKQEKEKKNIIYVKSIAIEYDDEQPAETKTWSFGWRVSRADGGEGLYNFGNTALDQDTTTATLNGLVWSATTNGSQTYSFTSGKGQYFGKVTESISHTSLFTYDIKGKVNAVRIKAYHAGKAGQEVYLKVSTNGIAYQHDAIDSVFITKDTIEYEFKPAAEAQIGKLDIELFQPSDIKGQYMMRSIEVDYEVEATAVKAPVLSLATGTYDAAQTCTITAPDYEEGSYSIYYTLDGTNPRFNGKVYTEPINIVVSSTLKAVTKVGDQFSDVVEANYVVRVSPEFKFEQDTMYIEAPDNAYSPYPSSKFYISDITFISSNPEVCIVSKLGVLYTIKPGVTTISACFAGNDKYLPDTASYTLIVLQKAPLPLPTVSPMGGTYDAPVEVSISVTGDERAKAIWYSVTAKDSAELTDEPTIIKATSGKITIKKSCRLLVLAAGDNVFSPLVEAEYTINEKLTAAFSADEASIVYYKQGFDSSDEIEGWNLYNSSSTTFRLEEEPTLKAGSSFSIIDPDNQYSLNIRYSDYEKQSEVFESPKMLIKPNSSVEFYSFFSGGFLYYANWYLSIYDETTGKETDLVNAFQWAQDNAYTGPAWIRFDCDLSEYENHELYFAFIYEGQGGEDAAFDGFKLKAIDMSDSAKIVINEDDLVHFHNNSIKANSVKWEFPGGEIINGDEQDHPIVAYSEAGTYDVKLIVYNGEETDTLIRKNYVEVKATMPKAIAGLPDEGYLSPFRATFIPTGVPVTFHDRSTGKPTERQWTFNGTNIEHSTDKDPVVTYTQAGTYSVGLEVKNNVGSDRDILYYAIQAGGAQNIWNIAPEENNDLDIVQIGYYYGYYAGSNWLDIYKFAEKFKAPLADATIDSVAIYFGSVTTITPDTAIVVEIQAVDTYGMPGEVLATGSVKASDLAWNDTLIVPTMFVLDKTANITGEFFVTISGIPNNYEGYDEDEIAILCHTRADGMPNSVFHYLAVYDEGYNDTGEREWVENESPLSMAVSPILSYGIPTGLDIVPSSQNVARSRKFMVKDQLYIQHGNQIYNAVGNKIK